MLRREIFYWHLLKRCKEVLAIFSFHLFDGGEAMKDSARTMLVNMGGILKAAVSAAVSKLIISLFTSTTGFWAVLTIPMIKGLVTAAMNTI
ncbi:MAG: hypothetical protein M9949_10730 [Candidatus Kapabacteria bacterium]|nr:hypothetical protein [Candidatus Kapabacteria bacterium]